MLAEEAELSSQYSADFRVTLQTRAAQARKAAQWGRALLLMSLILILLGGAFLGNRVFDSDSGLWGSVRSVSWVLLVLALMRFAFLLLQRSWELENQLVRLRVRADFLDNPRLGADMVKILEKESVRAGKSRAHRRLRRALYRLFNLGLEEELAPSASVQHLMGALETGVPDLAENHRAYILESLEHGG